MKRYITFFSTILFLLWINTSYAAIDGQDYPEVNGIKIANQWIFDRVHTKGPYTNNAICNQRARTATMDQGIIYVARSEENTVIIGNDTIYQSVIHRFSAVDGSQLEDLPLTLNGVPYGRFLGVASIGKDDFHHIWVAPMTSATQQFIPVYKVNTETGELTLVVELDKGDALYRTDYLDIIGDLNREHAECNIMAVSGTTADPGFPVLYRIHADRNGDWVGGFNGDPYLWIFEFYPETNVGFSLAPIIKMIEGPDEVSRYSGERFYVDGFNSAPLVYNLNGDLIDSFGSVAPELQPQYAVNGCIPFHLDGHDFLVYANTDMNGNGHGCQANICELGEGQSLGGMTKYWTIPADSLGKINDGGTRVHCFAVEYGMDDEGYEEVTLLTFKCYNGMAVYKIGKSVLDNYDYFEVDGISYYRSGNTVKVIKRLYGNTYSGTIIVPSHVTYQGKTYEVTEIDDYAFESNTQLSNVALPGSITRIGNNAFAGCGRLNSLAISGGIQSISSNAFSNTNISSLYLSSSVTSINDIGINPHDIYSYSSVPPTCNDLSFTTYSGRLHVPASSLAAYFTSPIWCNFANISGDAIEPNAITISRDTVESVIGTQFNLSASVTPTNATPNSVTWTSSDEAIATVYNGQVSAVGIGECNIIAFCANKHAICHVVVNDTTITITLDQQEAMILPNHIVTLTPSASPVMPEGFTVTSTDPMVAAARLVNGKVQVVGIKEGTTTITVGSADGTAVPATCLVTVYTEPGDVDMDGFINISDVTRIIDYLLSEDAENFKEANADLDNDGNVSISDVTALIDILLSSN